jgi:hypothetical protein
MQESQGIRDMVTRPHPIPSHPSPNPTKGTNPDKLFYFTPATHIVFSAISCSWCPGQLTRRRQKVAHRTRPPPPVRDPSSLASRNSPAGPTMQCKGIGMATAVLFRCACDADLTPTRPPGAGKCILCNSVSQLLSPANRRYQAETEHTVWQQYTVSFSSVRDSVMCARGHICAHREEFYLGARALCMVGDATSS